ncbi:hypothetical protein GN958_ATG04033, partial [Phytophthora infestans]
SSHRFLISKSKQQDSPWMAAFDTKRSNRRSHAGSMRKNVLDLNHAERIWGSHSQSPRADSLLKALREAGTPSPIPQ